MKKTFIKVLELDRASLLEQLRVGATLTAESIAALGEELNALYERLATAGGGKREEPQVNNGRPRAGSHARLSARGPRRSGRPARLIRALRATPAAVALGTGSAVRVAELASHFIHWAKP